MLRKILNFSSRWLGRGIFLGVLFWTPACAQRDAASSASIEQTASEQTPARSLETPALERGLHLANLGVDRWHAQGLMGRGMRVAILDSGFRDYRQFLGKGLPTRVKVRSFRKDENLEARNSQHGILCAEVVHALAPEAELLLANWEPDCPRAFLDAAAWAKAEGAKIFSCSLIMPSWSDGEGGGEVHRELQPLLGAGGAGSDVLCFASAGNIAERHWCGAYAPDRDGWHCWSCDATANRLTPWGPEPVVVELYGPLNSVYEVFVFQHDTGDLVGSAALSVDATRLCGRAVLRFAPTPKANYLVRLRCKQRRPQPQTDHFHLVVLGGSLAHATSGGSIPFPGDGAGVIAVGAVNVEGQRLAYSSCGPNSLLPKPDFVATVPFPSLCRERPFAGTSAASPQAAGLAALVWSRHPDWSASKIIQALRTSAIDLGPPGHDYDTGYGLIRLPR